MSESRKLNIDGGTVKQDDEPVATYKSVPESDLELKSGAKLRGDGEPVTDGADEKLLHKDVEAKIVTRVDMADAKYVVGDHRNGDANIEIDANKRPFAGLTKEELMKYADDPFWVRLRWSMFVLFWVLWFAMLAGAVVIIVRAPKCSSPLAKTWFEKGPLVDMSGAGSVAEVEAQLALLSAAHVQGVLVSEALVGDMYSVLDDKPNMFDDFKRLVDSAKSFGQRVIVDVTANFVHASHSWFTQSEKRVPPYDAYFTWAKGKSYDAESGVRSPPNQWRSVLDESAWVWSEARGEYYLAQFGRQYPDLNMRSDAVVARLDDALAKWMAAGASGVRLLKARQLLVSPGLEDEAPNPAARDAAVGQYRFYSHRRTSDQPDLAERLAHWAALVDKLGVNGETVFTIKEAVDTNAAFLYNGTEMALRPPSAGAVDVALPADLLAGKLNKLLGRGYWPTVQLDSTAEMASVANALALLLPATPILTLDQICPANESGVRSVESVYSHLVALRQDATVLAGDVTLQPLANNSLLVCARWKSGHSGYAVVVSGGGRGARADLAPLQVVPATVSVHAVAGRMQGDHANYTRNANIPSNNITMLPESAVVVSFVPQKLE